MTERRRPDSHPLRPPSSAQSPPWSGQQLGMHEKQWEQFTIDNWGRKSARAVWRGGRSGTREDRIGKWGLVRRMRCRTCNQSRKASRGPAAVELKWEKRTGLDQPDRILRRGVMGAIARAERGMAGSPGLGGCSCSTCRDHQIPNIAPTGRSSRTTLGASPVAVS